MNLKRNFVAGVAMGWLLLVLGGCAGRVDAARTSSMSCVELNDAVTTTSKSISETAISQTRIQDFEPPFAILGVERARAALAERQAGRLADLRAAQAAVTAERDRRCPD